MWSFINSLFVAKQPFVEEPNREYLELRLDILRLSDMINHQKVSAPCTVEEREEFAVPEFDPGKLRRNNGDSSVNHRRAA